MNNQLEIMLYNHVLPYFTKTANLKTPRVIEVGKYKYEFRVYRPIDSSARTTYDREVTRFTRDRIIEIITPSDSRRVIYYHHKQQLLEVLSDWQPYIVSQTVSFLTKHIPWLNVKQVKSFKIDGHISLDYAEAEYIINLRPSQPERDNPPVWNSNGLVYSNGHGYVVNSIDIEASSE